MEQQKSSNKNKIIAAFIVIILIAAGAFILPRFLKKYFLSNTNLKEKAYLCIPTGAKYSQVLDSVKKNNLLKDVEIFNDLASDKGYPNKIKPGKYAVNPGATNRALINMLISGNQEPVKLSFQNLRLKKDFASFIGKKLEVDSVKMLSLMNDKAFTEKYGFTTDDFYTMFIPNSYEFYWNTTTEDFIKKMNEEYLKFWTSDRKTKASALNLSEKEVSILASIVDAEALVDSELPIIAGLYLNRLNRGIKLEADPTVIFAANDFTIRRVLNKQLAINSPYNTYKYSGLPPGPIMMPSVKAIDAVLNHNNHNYIFMCAKEDFSGYHNFAETEAEHLVNARKFQNALNERNIKR